MKFSKEKFQSLSPERQIRKYLQFIEMIEKNWQNQILRTDLLREFSSCLAYSDLAEINQLNVSEENLRGFIRTTMPLLQKYGSEKRDHDFIIHTNDGRREQNKKPIYLILNELRSAFNIGSIFRTAECFGVSEIIVIGYTAGAENSKVIKTSMNTASLTLSRHFSTLAKAREYLKEKGVTIYAMETVENASDFGDTKLQFPAAFILGNEALGISAEDLELADDILEIPLLGWKNSLNVGVTAAICCYEANKQL